MVEIGKVSRPIGLRGELKVDIYSGNTKRLLDLTKIYVDGDIYGIAGARPYKEAMAVKLDGVNTVEDAERLRNSTVSLGEEQLPDLPNREYYIKDLTGLDVIGLEGEVYGKLSYVNQNGPQDIYEVRNESDDLILIPAVKDYVKEVSLGDKKITVDIPEDLVDLNRKNDGN